MSSIPTRTQIFTQNIDLLLLKLWPVLYWSYFCISFEIFNYSIRILSTCFREYLHPSLNFILQLIWMSLTLLWPVDQGIKRQVLLYRAHKEDAGRWQTALSPCVRTHCLGTAVWPPNTQGLSVTSEVFIERHSHPVDARDCTGWWVVWICPSAGEGDCTRSHFGWEQTEPWTQNNCCPHLLAPTWVQAHRRCTDCCSLNRSGSTLMARYKPEVQGK